MYGIITASSLLALLLISLISTPVPVFATAPPINNDYQRKLKQVEKVNRSFQLLNAQILNQVLSGLGMSMEYFLEKSSLLNKLADRCLMESGIYVTVNLAYYDYYKYIKDNIADNVSPSMLETIAMTHEEMKPHLVDAIIGASKEVDIKSCSNWKK